MVRISSCTLRAVFSRPFLFIVLVGILLFVPTMFDKSLQAVTTQGSQRMRNTEPSDSGLLEIKNELRSIEIEFDSYLAQAAVDSPENRGLSLGLNEVSVQLRGRLGVAKEQLQNSGSRDRAYREGAKRIARLEERILEQQSMAGQPAVIQTKGIGDGTSLDSVALQSTKLGPTATGAISGTVTDGIAGLNLISVQFYTSTGTFITSVSTNPSGVYTSPATLATGNYFVKTFNSFGYIDELFNNITCLSCSVTTGTPVAVTDGVTTLNINFALATGGRISGAVTDSTPAPIQSVSVQIYNSSGVFQTSTSSDSSGNYLTNGLPAGNYFAQTFNSLGYINEVYDNITCAPCTVTTGVPISVTTGATTMGINFSLATGGRISGVVTDSGSTPLASVSVFIYNSAGTFVTSGFTNSGGNYTSSAGLLTGNYFALTANSLGYVNELYDNIACLGCAVTTGTPIAVTAGSTTFNINFALPQGGGISGTVTNAATSAGLVGVSVRIFNSSGIQVNSVNTVGPTGAYSSNVGLPAGTYYARTSNTQGFLDELYDNLPCSAGCTVTTGTSITVTAGMTTSGINFPLTAGGRISGTVTDASTMTGINLVDVRIFNSSGVLVTTATTDPSGNYLTTAALATGTYYAVTANLSNYLDELYDNIPCVGCTVTTGNPIMVTAGATTLGINFGLTLGGSISGTVTDAATTNGISATVQIFTSTGLLVTQVVTNATTGNYVTTTGLTAGTYYARTTNTLGYVNKLYNNITCLTCAPISGNPISVTTGSTTTGINFALAVGGQVSGTVTNAATMAGLTGVSVRIFNSLGAQVATANSVAGGNYTITTGLPTDTYYARAFSGQGFTSQSFNGIDCLTCTPTLGTPISVTAGSTTMGKNFALNAGGRLSGTITDAVTSAPLAFVQVQILAPSGAIITTVGTNALGSYISGQGLPTGKYFARTVNQSGYIDQVYANTVCAPCDATMGTPIFVTAGATTTGINFALIAGGRISGTITDSVTAAPLPDFEVDIFDSAGNFLDATSTDGLGNYISVVGLPSGTYYAVTFNLTEYADEAYNNVSCAGCDPITGTPIVVTAGSTALGINFALARGGRVSGVVSDAATLAPIGGISVQIFNSSGIIVTAASTNATGNYTTSGTLPTGTYYARAANNIGYIREVFNDRLCLACDVPTTGDGITVTAPSTTSGINFSLDVGGRIFGALNDISDLTSIPAANIQDLPATVDVYNSSGTLVSISVAGGLGNHLSNALPAGTYYARTTNPRGFVDKLYNNIQCLTCTPTTGTPITVSVGSVTSGINFGLCSYLLSPSNTFYTDRGGEGSIGMTAAGTCAWTATSNDSWIEISSSTGGSGSEKITYVVRENFGAVRTGTMTVANRTFTITQAAATGACAFNISPTFASYGAGGGAGSINVTGAAGCAWQAATGDNWVVITSGCCGTGNGAVNYVVLPRTTGAARAGVITVAGKKFSVKQK